MIQITDKSKCCGCSACASVCPKAAITMKSDAEGFAYPEIDTALCVNCGMCDKVCPLTHSLDNTLLSTYAVQHKAQDVLTQSTSGGMFTALSDLVLRENGVVYGAAFDNSMAVRHVRATTAEERDRMRGSKYVQSDVNGVFSCVKADLAAGLRVLFVGTPCQVDGLKHFLGKNTKGLICCDLICHGTPSPLIFEEHLHFLEEKKHKKLKAYHFRPKHWGWHVHREMAVFEDGREYHSRVWSDLWQTIYYGRIATRPSCHDCHYSNLSRPGDLSIGDCRGIDRVSSAFKSDDGVSLVLVNTPLGQALFEQLSDKLLVEKIDIADVMQPPLKQCSKPSARRTLFFETYKKRGYKKAIRACFGRLYAPKYYIKKLLKR